MVLVKTENLIDKVAIHISGGSRLAVPVQHQPAFVRPYPIVSSLVGTDVEHNIVVIGVYFAELAVSFVIAVNATGSCQQTVAVLLDREPHYVVLIAVGGQKSREVFKTTGYVIIRKQDSVGTGKGGLSVRKDKGVAHIVF